MSKPVKTLTQAQKNDVPFDLFVKIADSRVEVLLNGKVIKTVDRKIAATGSLAVNAKPAANGIKTVSATSAAQDVVEPWIEVVRVALLDVKRKYPDQFKIRVEPEAHVTLQTLMAFMDGARKLRPEDGEILGKDEKGKPIKLQFLFPNVILKGIYG